MVFVGMGMFMIVVAVAGAAGTGFFQMFMRGFAFCFFHMDQHSFPDAFGGFAPMVLALAFAAKAQNAMVKGKLQTSFLSI